MQSTWNIKRISSEWPSSGDFEGALQSDKSVPGVSEVLWKYSNDTGMNVNFKDQFMKK